MNPLLLNSSDFNSSSARLDNWTSCQQQNNLSSCNETFVVDDVSSQTMYVGKVYWALVMIPLPLVAVVGNILVILSVYKERNLQSATNYFIVSLAFADLLVAAVVMPFAVYVLVSNVSLIV
ncbi:dopamine D2-like receptor [Trichonephila inaurata madagascariensis]|uniref:Dopamine D2-like receptor n=1 Tax=Trichonephila inaurata madagascariensis TaxID=2747483 RepID=A0A8X7CGI4_9ARAC|nr:dopamine D2-like receptor [Trichonephila inaurata madagascariensis]